MQHILKIFILSVAAILLAHCTHIVPHEPKTIIRNVTIISPSSRATLKEHEVVVQNGRITDVRPQTEDSYEHEEIIDGHRGYLLPGFIDMHAHILIPSCISQADNGVTFDIPLSEKMLGTLLDFGITTIRSPSNPTKEGLALRNRANAGNLKAPYILAATEFINDRKLNQSQIRSVIREALPYKPDFVKIYAGIKPDVVAAAIDEAHAHNIQVIGHMGQTSWKEAADMGIDFLTHAVDWSEKMLSPDKREVYRALKQERGSIKARIDWLELFDPNSLETTRTIDAIAKAGVSIDPTLVAYDSKFSPPDTPRYRQNPNKNVLPGLLEIWEACGTLTDNWEQNDFQRWAKAYPKIPQFLRQLAAAGVLMTTGSDVPNSWVIPGESLHQEFELLVEAGFSPDKVIKMATINGAEALGLDKEIGTIEIGKQADLVLLRDSPLENISNTRSIIWVMEDGSIID